mmetsp:Transcript_33648/g.68342  ORF Transcript_33648/g.68342 Transcript_33648/m.68342 type:complete len:205 (-) Transcript_33648:7108-7722(-)
MVKTVPRMMSVCRAMGSLKTVERVAPVERWKLCVILIYALRLVSLHLCRRMSRRTSLRIPQLTCLQARLQRPIQHPRRLPIRPQFLQVLLRILRQMCKLQSPQLLLQLQSQLQIRPMLRQILRQMCKLQIPLLCLQMFLHLIQLRFQRAIQQLRQQTIRQMQMQLSTVLQKLERLLPSLLGLNHLLVRRHLLSVGFSSSLSLEI